MQNASDTLGPDGPLARHLAGFSPRLSQQQMAECIEHVLAEGGVFIAESGTGTGKTFAYLVPALLCGRKVIISTGTRHLQDQIYRRDLPLVREALSVPVSTALLKGRSNYLCLHRLQQATNDVVAKQEGDDYLRLLREWSRETVHGDISEVSTVPEDAPIWMEVTSTAENCLGGNCPQYDECHVRKARRTALAADVLVVNHHLFFADLALREEGFGRLLPGVDAVIFDEAHQMPEIATLFFGQSISRTRIENLARDVIAEELREQSGIAGLHQATGAAGKAAADFRLALALEPGRNDWESQQTRETEAALQNLFDRLNEVAELLSLAAGHGEGLANCLRRALDILDCLDNFREGSRGEYVRWTETTRRGFVLYLTPLDISQPFLERAQLEQHSWVFTSATLAIDGDFAHFQRQFGLEQSDTMQWPSPFDFEHRTLMYLPQGLPNPNSDGYTAKVVDAVIPVLSASRGRAFMLFTSHRAMNAAARLLADKLSYPLLVQGTAPKQAMLQQFRESGNSVLLGTSSFWEGVDVRGEALSCVIIDKLPFAAPDDPVLRARGRAMEGQGRNAFIDYQVPQAVIALKQGVGRLMRDEEDSGVLVLCDPRIVSKGYGKIFLASLPPMPKTRELDDVKRFYQQQAVNATEATIS